MQVMLGMSLQARWDATSNSNSIYLYSAMFPECSEALVTSLLCVYNNLLKRVYVKSQIA